MKTSIDIEELGDLFYDNFNHLPLSNNNDEWGNAFGIFRAGYEAAQPKWIIEQDKQPWSFLDLFQKMIDGTDILLHKKDYDAHGWEEFEGAYRQSVALIEKIRAAYRESLSPSPPKTT